MNVKRPSYKEAILYFQKYFRLSHKTIAEVCLNITEYEYIRFIADEDYEFDTKYFMFKISHFYKQIYEFASMNFKVQKLSSLRKKASEYFNTSNPEIIEACVAQYRMVNVFASKIRLTNFSVRDLKDKQ